MTCSATDILEAIALKCDPDEIVSRLNMTSFEICDALSERILDNLEEFYDVYEDDPE